MSKKDEDKKISVKELIDISFKEVNEMSAVSDACGQFRSLLTEQLGRVMSIKENMEPKNFSEMDRITVGICPGDGIGPAICQQAIRVLEVLLKDELESGRIVLKPIEGLTIENRLEKQQAVPEDILNEIKTCDVLLKGPMTTPKGGNLESANVALRRELDLYANVRPVKIPEEGIDWIFFRENTEGEYTLGSRGIEIPGKLSIDFKVISEPGTERIARRAYEYAKNNGMTNVNIVTKANIMKKTDGNFSRICHEVALDYPELKLDDYYIDIMTAKLLDKDIRSDFQVFVLPNLYGDIITDEAAQIQGGVGTAGSANIGDRYAMFEAVHGSAIRMVEDGIEAYADPSGIIRAAEMMLRHIGFMEEADRLRSVMDICCEKEHRVVVTGTRAGATGEEFTDYILETLEKYN